MDRAARRPDRIFPAVTDGDGYTGTDEPETSASSQGIHSVELAADVLRAIEEGLGTMSLTQIAAGVGGHGRLALTRIPDAVGNLRRRGGESWRSRA